MNTHIVLNDAPQEGSIVRAICGQDVRVGKAVAVKWSCESACEACYIARDSEKYREAKRVYAVVKGSCSKNEGGCNDNA